MTGRGILASDRTRNRRCFRLPWLLKIGWKKSNAVMQQRLLLSSPLSHISELLSSFPSCHFSDSLEVLKLLSWVPVRGAQLLLLLFQLSCFFDPRLSVTSFFFTTIYIRVCLKVWHVNGRVKKPQGTKEHRRLTPRNVTMNSSSCPRVQVKASCSRASSATNLSWTLSIEPTKSASYSGHPPP